MGGDLERLVSSGRLIPARGEVYSYGYHCFLVICGALQTQQIIPCWTNLKTKMSWVSEIEFNGKTNNVNCLFPIETSSFEVALNEIIDYTLNLICEMFIMLKLEKSDLNQKFAARLRDALLAKGYHSSRSPSGVHVQKFADLTGHSLQICRKYLRGQAIPESPKLMEIAAHLEVSPGWLLFGDCHGQTHGQANKITINKELLHYIFVHVSALHQPQPAQAEFCSQFFMTLTQDISQISDDVEQSKKIIDLAVSAAHKSTASSPSLRVK